KTFGTKQNSWTPYAGLFYVDEMDGQGTFDVNGDFQGDSDIGGSSIVVEGGVTGQIGKWVLSGGLYWQDGDALKSIIGGQISVRYAF
ncbi:MAG: autotransporter outer membrane beta-barrel domain-containing protein, partial [Steroidobacteraceae bacterium]|nr:autotransporter outer membrane beta-barrel domain-containing protein [Steroidobacteraceae bacterium]